MLNDSILQVRQTQPRMEMGCVNRLMMIYLVSWPVPITLNFLPIHLRFLFSSLKLSSYSSKVFIFSSGTFSVLRFWLLDCNLRYILLQEIMYKKLLYAISEGQGSFDLSWAKTISDGYCLIMGVHLLLLNQLPILLNISLFLAPI